jgi:hypothetical protein
MTVKFCSKAEWEMALGRLRGLWLRALPPR